MPYLVYDNSISKRAISVADDAVEFYIGRSMDNDVRLREDSSVSRKHCMIFRDPVSGEYVLRDLDSSNGTYLNDLCLKVQQCPVEDGDVIGIGGVKFTFRLSSRMNSYQLVDTATIHVHEAVSGLSSDHGYSCEDTAKLDAVVPPGVVTGDGMFPRVKGFEFIRLLGVGKYSSTYLVFQTRLKRTVVLKVFVSDVFTNEEQHLFLQQITNAGKLNHSSILGFMDVGVSGSLCYVTMPYASQGTLGNLISQFPEGIAEKDATGYILLIAKAMQYISKHGMLHGNIVPSNILLNEKLMPMISDLGLARWVSHVFQPERNFFFGTTVYMSPEQTLDQELGWTADQYALGVIYYELLTGVPPFFAPSAYALIEKHLRETVRFPSNKAISVKAKNIITRLMAKKPEERFSSWGSVIDAICSESSQGASRKNMPLQKKHAPRVKKTKTGIEISAKKSPRVLKRKM